MISFNREEKNLMLIQTLNYFSVALASIFVTIYFFNHSDLKTTVLFNLISYISLLFFYISTGWTLRFFSSAFLIRISLLASSLFYLFLFLLKSQSTNFIIPLGILSGFSAGNYWAGYNLNQYLFTNKEKRVEFFGSITGLINLLSAVAPLIGGLIISIFKLNSPFGAEAGYNFLFFLVFLILILMFFIAGTLPKHRVPNFSYTHIIHHKRSKTWKLIILQQFFLGLYDSSLGIITGVLFFLILKNEFNLGGTQTLAYLLGSIGSIISIKLLNKNKKFFWIGSIGLVIGITFFALFKDTVGIIFFILVNGISSPFLNNWISITYFKSLDLLKTHWTEKYHLMLERDMAIGIPRILSLFLILLFIRQGDEVRLASISLYFLAVFPLILGFLLNRTDLLNSENT